MRNQLRTALLLGSLTALIMGVGALVAPGQLHLFGALALAMNVGAWFFIVNPFGALSTVPVRVVRR